MYTLSDHVEQCAISYEIMTELKAEPGYPVHDDGSRDLGMSGDILAIGRNQFVSY